MLYEKMEFLPNIPLKFQLVHLEEYPFHMHSDVLEIIFCVEGSAELTAVNTVIPMKKGDIYICSPRELHGLCRQGDEKPVMMQIYLDIEAYRMEFPEIDTYQFANGAFSHNREAIRILEHQIEKLMSKMVNENEHRQIDYYKEGAQILKILVQRFQCYNIVNYYPEFSDAFKGHEIQLSRIRRIVDYIYRNCNKPIKIEDIANMEHISTSYLTYILNIGCGMGFRMFLNMARVEKSAALLLEDELSLQKIAYESGFSKYEYYSKTFKTVFRMTPKKYKQIYMQKTIVYQPIKVEALSRKELEELHQQFYIKKQEIIFDLNAKDERRQINLPHCAALRWSQYNHISDFHRLQQLKSRINIEAVGFSLSYLSKFKNKPQMLDCIVSDLWKQQCGIRIYVDNSDCMEELKAGIHLLNHLETVQHPYRQHYIEFAVRNGAGECSEFCREAFDYISSQYFNAFFLRDEEIFDGVTSFSMGEMPCVLLHAVLEDKKISGESVAIMGSKENIEDGKLALLFDAGIKTPIYYLFNLMKRMGPIPMEQGNGYLITRNRRTNEFQVLIYNYNDSDCAADLEGKLCIENIFGTYVLKKYRFSPGEYMKKHGELSRLMSKAASEEVIELADRALAPETSVSVMEANGSYRTSFKLEPFGIFLLSFEQL